MPKRPRRPRENLKISGKSDNPTTPVRPPSPHQPAQARTSRFFEVSNWVFGVLRDVSDGFGAGLGALMVLMTVACLCALYLERRRARSQKWHFRPPDVD